MNTAQQTVMPIPTFRHRMLAKPLVRGIVAALAVIVPLAAALMLSEAIAPKHLRVIWPNILAMLACLAGYGFYVHRVEKRPLLELSGPGAFGETLAGAGLGLLLSLGALLPLWLLNVYQVQGVNAWTVLLKPAAGMALVAVFEELLCRAVLFRLVEKSWGTRTALIVSLLFFIVAHLPNEHISAIGVLNTGMAGIGLSAAYMATRRLWLPIGLHFVWNYLFDAVFSIPVSGQPAKGLLQGAMHGPEWLSGGAYGIEASILTLLVWSLASLILLRLAQQRGHIIPRPR
ncbi:CPBP family intramembrane glutamic endopeptidase [Massilia sp. YIM B04103]|uniref:CPBP family intramembrane glutamic endopeptidase n=1 Tax=Massilia sp. YIM B04103 TaxID=2963106 RepID=UPI00210BA48D|nr:type II CAAX endopeptidase family protein [Massilia sp. YIM B04103]